MNIYYDHQVFTLQRVGGISRYFVRLAECLQAIGHSVSIGGAIHQNHFLENSAEFGRRRLYVSSFPRGVGRISLSFNQSVERLFYAKNRLDIIHETFYTHTTSFNSKIPRITTVHDMIHEKFPESFPQQDRTSFFKKQAAESSDHIICVSGSTKNDLMDIFGIPERKITVTHLGIDVPYFSNQIKSPLLKHLSKPYLLFVGNRSGYKNFNRFIEAYASDQYLLENFCIVAFGGGPFSEIELSLFNGFGIANDVFQMSGDDTILNSLYKNAQLLVFPSEYEGFGLPPIEAMANQCPVVCSNVSSIPEVVGDAGVFFNPSDLDDMVTAIKNVLQNVRVRDNFIQRGNERVKSLTWKSCAEQTLSVYSQFC